MSKGRLEAFTDGVLAIVITIMVLGLQPPRSGTFAALWALRYPFFVYFVSFLWMAVYWNNHHHMFQVVKRVDGKVLWANMLFLLISSLFPFATAWVGQQHMASHAPEFFFGVVVLLNDTAFYLLIRALIHANGQNSKVKTLLGPGYYKPYVAMGGNLVALGLAFVWPPLTLIVNTLLLLPWVMPERRIESHLTEDDRA